VGRAAAALLRWVPMLAWVSPRLAHEEEEKAKAAQRAQEQAEYEAMRSLFVVEEAGAQSDAIETEVRIAVGTRSGGRVNSPWAVPPLSPVPGTTGGVC
jgi:hypothetical protein